MVYYMFAFYIWYLPFMYVMCLVYMVCTLYMWYLPCMYVMCLVYMVCAVYVWYWEPTLFLVCRLSVLLLHCTFAYRFSCVSIAFKIVCRFGILHSWLFGSNSGNQMSSVMCLCI